MPRAKKKSLPAEPPKEHRAPQEHKPMPSLVFNEVHFDNPEKSAASFGSSEQGGTFEEELLHRTMNYRSGSGNGRHNRLLPTNNPTPPTGAKIYLGLSIALVMAVILAVWAYALPGQLALSRWNKTAEFSIINKTKATLSDLFDSSSLTPAPTGTKTLSQILSDLESAANASSSAPTTSFFSATTTASSSAN